MANHGTGKTWRGPQKADGGRSSGVPARRRPRPAQKTGKGKGPHAPEEAAKHAATSERHAHYSSSSFSTISREGGRCSGGHRCHRTLRYCCVGRAASFGDPDVSPNTPLAIRRVSVIRSSRIPRLGQRRCRGRQTEKEAYVLRSI
jgi:hypothetical protein